MRVIYEDRVQFQKKVSLRESEHWSDPIHRVIKSDIVSSFHCELMTFVATAIVVNETGDFEQDKASTIRQLEDAWNGR